jgi:hypothetical protein
MRFENRRLVQQDFRQLVSYGTAVAVPDHETTPSETPENISKFASILSAAKTSRGFASNGVGTPAAWCRSADMSRLDVRRSQELD